MRNLLLNWQVERKGGNSMRNEKSTPTEARALNSEKSTLKDSDYFENNQFINELNRYLVEIENRKKSIRRRHLIFDLVFSIGMALLIIHLILQW